jgi:CDP-paratose 2-epimerase
VDGVPFRFASPAACDRSLTLHILITGGAGFVGSELAVRLAKKNHRVVVMDNLVRRGSESNLERLARHGVSFVHGDVRNPEDFENLPPGVEFLIDVSAQPSVVSGYSNPVFDITNNSLGVIRVLEFARRHRCPMIFFSTNRVYVVDRLLELPRREAATRIEWDPEAWNKLPSGTRIRGFDPVHGVSEEFAVDGGQRSIYGLSKLIADASCQEYARAFDMPLVINRFGVIAGTGQFAKLDQGWVVWWAIAHYFKLPLKYIGWNGKQVRDVLFLDDVCSLVELQMGEIARFRGDIFNLGGGSANSLSLREGTNLLEHKLGHGTSITVEDAVRKGDLPVYFTDNRKGGRELNWKPSVTLDRGFDKILAWIRANEDTLRKRYT